MNIPLNDLSRQYPRIRNDMDRAVLETIRAGTYTLGEQVTFFEKEFADFCKTPYGAGVGSGTDAIALALRALGVGAGDDVVIPANAYPTAFAVAIAGPRVRLVDCGQDGNIDCEKLAKAITTKTKAVVAVHLYGNPADVFSIRKLMETKKRKIFLVEDAAQAHGTRVAINQQRGTQTYGQNIQAGPPSRGQVYVPAGSLGDAGCFSFYPTKNLGAYGDGGMVVTSSKQLWETLRKLRMYGEANRYESETVSGVSRLDELQAAVLRVKLRHLPEWNRRRASIAEYYERELLGTGDVQFVRARPEVGTSCHHLFVLRTSRRDELKVFLVRAGIGVGVHYPVPVHLTRAFSSLKFTRGDFPMAESLSREILSLPLFPELTLEEAERVVDSVKQFFRG